MLVSKVRGYGHDSQGPARRLTRSEPCPTCPSRTTAPRSRPPPRTRPARLDDRHRRARAERPQHPDGRSRRPDPAARRALPEPDGALQPRAGPRAQRARQGLGCVRRVRDHRGRLGVHQGGAVPAGREDRDAGPLLDRGRRAGLPRHLARPARLRAEVLHDRGQLRPRRQQHPGLLHPRHDEVPALHPLAEAPWRQRPARQQHAVGLLEPQPGVGAPGDLPDGRPRHPEDLPAHERLRLAHLPVGQRGRREALGEVPLPQRPGRRGPHRRGRHPDRRRGRRLPPPRPLRLDRRRRLPVLDAVDPGDAVRGREDLPDQPVRPDQDLAAQRLPADQGRHDDAEPQPGELLRPDRAGRVRAERARARHRLLPRQDAARPRVRVLRHPPPPDRRRTTCSCRSTGRTSR